MEIGDLFSVHMAMVLAFELPDLDADNASGKTVLAVRIGGTTTRCIIGLLLLTPIVLVATAVASDSHRLDVVGDGSGHGSRGRRRPLRPP